MNKSVINSYRLNPTPPPATGIIAGRIVPVAAPPDYRRAVVVLAALVLPLLAVGVVVYAVRTVQPAPVALATALPVAIERVIEATPVMVERVAEVQASPVIIIIAVTPAPVQPARQAAPPQPVQRAPVVNPPAPRPTARPTVRPTAPPPVSGGPVRAAGVSAPISASDSGPQERLLSRACQFPDAPQGTVIKDYYTDERGVKRDAVCKPDGWKAVD